MLKRDTEKITQMVYFRWANLGQADQDAYQAARKAVISSFDTDPRVIALTDAFTELGVLNAPRIVTGILGGGSIAYVSPSWNHTKGLKHDIAVAEASIPVPAKRKGWNESSASTELAVALSSAKSKWADIQSPLYGLASDLATAKTEEDIEAAIRTFTAAIV